MYSAEVKTADLIWLGERLADAGRHEMRAQQPGVPAAEFVIMRHLLDSQPSTITSLANRTGYAQSRVSSAVSSLVERGWAQTTSDPADGRRTVVSVPDHIRQVAIDGLTAETHTLDRLLDGLPAARRRAILGTLDELLEVLRAEPVTSDASSSR